MANMHIVIAKFKPRLFALTNDQGTACVETTLTEFDYDNPKARAYVEQNREQDVTTTWVEVSDNEVCQDWINAGLEMI